MPFDRKEYNKEYYHKNKQYRQTPQRIKLRRIRDWKSRGVIHQNFDELYEKFINTEYCELCNIKLTIDKKTTKTTRVLDQDHKTGEFRNILCHSCNIKRG